MTEGRYVLKLLPELGWGILFAVGAYIAQFAVETPGNVVEEWQSYLYALAVGSLRIVGALVLNFFRQLIANPQT